MYSTLKAQFRAFSISIIISLRQINTIKQIRQFLARYNRFVNLIGVGYGLDRRIRGVWRFPARQAPGGFHCHVEISV